MPAPSRSQARLSRHRAAARDVDDDEPTPRLVAPRAVTFGPSRALGRDERSSTELVRRPVSLPSDAFSLLEAPSAADDRALDDDSAVATVLRLPPRVFAAPATSSRVRLSALWRRTPLSRAHAAMVAAAAAVVVIAALTTPRVEPLVYEDAPAATATPSDARSFIVDDLATPFVVDVERGAPRTPAPKPPPRARVPRRPPPLAIVHASVEPAPIAVARPARRAFRRVFTAGPTP